MQHAWGHKLQRFILSGPTVHSLYCAQKRKGLNTEITALQLANQRERSI